MIVITGATGQLGRLVIKFLLERIPASEIIAAVRDPEKAKDLAGLGVEVRQADYNVPSTLTAAFKGAEKLLLISSSEIGSRVSQHLAVIEAAKQADVKLIAYTSILKADTSPLALASEHLETEQALKRSGVPFVVLRNGWYTENYAASIQPAIAHSAFIGSASDGKIASAAREDYALAAATVLLSPVVESGTIYELAGDDVYTLTEFANEIARQSGKAVSYVNLPQADFAAALEGAGLPKPFAALLADSDIGASKDGLFDDSHQLRSLIGRPTQPYSSVIAAALNT
ncbi:NAD(P)-dependent oxidoreductase [Methylovorus sp. MM2]|uniref:SDR family oxidoreductase n=1 Tax=Methylovorus sp. MM2 TaxID=1848038 RepID=UPI0007E20607|nr:SDR family oxidoreductase [Methylovorus sp. MM2]OAM53212.1 NAD(P)-dependent oxidoreductase [Methylovorus sp. MM2]